MKAIRRWQSVIFVLSICVVWAFLYLPHLRTSPAWYGDETLTHAASLSLVRGVPSNWAIWNTFWHPHYPYQPAYSLVAGTFAAAAGGDIWGSRFFNSLLALCCGLVLFALGRKAFGSLPALFAALMFLTYVQSVIHFRMCYAHNIVGLGLLIMTLFLLRPAGWKNDWLAGLGLGMAAGGHPLFIHGALTGLLCRLKRPRSWIPLLAPSAAYLVISMGVLYWVFGPWLLEDLVHLKQTFGGRGEADGGGLKGLENMGAFILQDWFHVGLTLGLLLSLRLRRYAATVVGLGVLFLLVRNRQNLILFYYQAIVILPVLCLGWAGAMRALQKLAKSGGPVAKSLPLALFCLPAWQFSMALPVVLQGKLQPRNHYWVTQSVEEVEAVAAWVNARTKLGDVVGANPNVAWLLDANTVPYLQMITWYGVPTQGYESGNKLERFRFNASLENCRFAIIGDIDQRWTFGEPNVMQLVEHMEKEQWSIVWQGTHYLILSNPRFPNGQ